MVPRQKPPTTKDLLAAVNDAPDVLTAVVKGHQCIEEMLAAAVSDALAIPHAVEVADLSFPLKVDLAVGLGMLDPVSRGAFVRLNKIRNGFAHSRSFRFGEDAARDLINALSPLQRRMLGALGSDGDPDNVLHHVIGILFVQVQSRIAQARDRRAADAELLSIVREVLGPSPRPGHPRDMARVEGAVKAARARRESDGEP